MKCPKCGSTDIDKYYPREDEEQYYLECQNCYCDITKHQARLDRVLSVATKLLGTERVLKHTWSFGSDLCITYYDNILSLNGRKISLETVESLLKDLGVFDE